MQIDKKLNLHSELPKTEMAQVISVGLGCKKQIEKKRLIENLVKKQADPSFILAHSTNLSYSLSTTMEADLSLIPQRW